MGDLGPEKEWTRPGRCNHSLPGRPILSINVGYNPRSTDSNTISLFPYCVGPSHRDGSTPVSSKRLLASELETEPVPIASQYSMGGPPSPNSANENSREVVSTAGLSSPLDMEPVPNAPQYYMGGPPSPNSANENSWEVVLIADLSSPLDMEPVSNASQYSM